MDEAERAAIRARELREQREREAQMQAEIEAKMLSSQEEWKHETQELKKELEKVKENQQGVDDAVERKLQEKLGQWDGNPHKTPLGHVMVALPKPVSEKVEHERELEGDEEYWLQNLNGIKGSVSDRSKLRERAASTVQFMNNEEGMRGDDISNIRSKVGTDREYFEN